MNNNEYQRLLFEDNISVIFIITSILNIIANKIVEKAILTKNYQDYNKALNLYKLNIIITIFIYIYFMIRNNYFLEQALKNNEDGYFEKIRLIGSILIFIGTLMLAYTLFEDQNQEGEVEI